ncbi:MAG TPA: OsmC family peroxiredoxin [Aquifex aeolicus]|uniref:OsmC family peroxiredoxin n=1 Tax=Aquifex aeolicus TaxID=63363 RepID=A0A9D1CG30_AQUAO|nr:OsmC family peroxiredoxin [Aquificales bacterium]HIP86645.1 OsmC family peroxiredoxin [Aquifex sp.]HIP98078.1 OsmC family peroxiredoxin [Aquifex aeolicus]HIQ26474.1 OsmC family peroxiredoxin [Aquifex aeolicus]
MKGVNQAPNLVKVFVKHLERFKFEGLNSEGKKVLIDGKPPFGDGEYPTPMELLLISLGGCTAIDVLSILNKKRVKVEDFSVEVEGIRREEHPKVYTYIKVRYIFKGDIPERAVERAIKLSMEKYCSVSAMLKATAKVEWEYEILK